MDNGQHQPATRADLQVVRKDVEVLTTDVAVLTTDVAVLKTDVGVLKTDVRELKTDIRQLRSEVREKTEELHTEFQRGFDDLKESMRDGQTEILKAFYNYAQTTDLKLKNGEAAMRIFGSV